MTKRELIDEIMEINISAGPGFLSRFSDNELKEYLQHLQIIQEPRNSYAHAPKQQQVAVCQAPATAVLTHDRELGRWDEYLDRHAVSQSQNDQLDAPAESQQASHCTAVDSDDDNQAWLF
ncbi:MAG: hypothetical protein KAR11_00825 [Phycisphaerae bacterium]|nr:hypothetical protein [Phycisphaerae bacterium]